MELYATPYHGGKEHAITFSDVWMVLVSVSYTLVYVGATSEICIYHPEVALYKQAYMELNIRM